ncbi:hypothetical protein ACFLYA_02335 [Candidatus Dependentiae bacterium]
MERQLFGTDGIRGKVGEFPLRKEDITKLADAIATWAQSKYGAAPHILLCRDTRNSGQHIVNSFKKQLLHHKSEIYEAGIIPTPAAIKIIQINRLDFAIVITASHNPFTYNGIKIIDAHTGKLDPADEKKITDLFYQQESGCFLPCLYVNTVSAYFEKNILSGITVALDCANGATYEVAPEIFKKLGAHVIAIGNKPDGKNINHQCGSLYPQHLQKTVLASNADIGFAFDGDGDRVVVVNKDGQLKDGDDILCILSEHPAYNHETQIVGTIMANYGLEAYLNTKGKKLIRTQVGDKCVSQAMKEKKLSLGGEQSGHIVMRDYLCSGDGIFAALRLIETIKLHNNWELKTFEKYPQFMINIPVKEKKDLSLPPYSTIITEYKKNIKNGKIIVRYSGTENVLRVMVQEQDHDIAKHMCENVSNRLSKELNA